jgi:integrase
MTNYRQARDKYLDSLAGFRRDGTIAHCARATELFVEFVAGRPTATNGEQIALLRNYAQWLLSERGLKPSTTRLYTTDVKLWFKWMSIHDHLPRTFPIEKAIAELNEALSGSIFDQDRRPPEPPVGIEQVIDYYNSPAYADMLRVRLKDRTDDNEYARRLSLEMLRNRALLHCLAESGGRISEVLSLRVGDFPSKAFEGDDVWRVEVTGKRGRRYSLRFLDALPYVKRYLAARGAAADTALLFIAHSKRYEGRALSRQAAWHVVDQARRALGLPAMHPHDFRHYRATQLVNAGEPLDVVQDYLGHRSVETTRAYYARTKEKRVDEAVKRARVGKDN